MVAGGAVSESVLSPTCYVQAGAHVSGSVLLNGVRVGQGAVVRSAIIDKGVTVPPGVQVGVDKDHDRHRGFIVEDGLTVVAKDQVVPSE